MSIQSPAGRKQRRNERVPSSQLSAAQRRKRKERFRRFVRWAVTLIVIAGAAFLILRRAAAPKPPSYSTYTAAIGSISNSESFSGTLQLMDSATVTAPSADRVRSVYVADGDPVTKGQRLIRLRSGTTLYADFDGRVDVVSVAEGDDVAADATLLSYADFDHLRVRIRISEYKISAVSIGEPCMVHIASQGVSLPCTVTSISHVSSGGGNTAYYIGYVDVDVSKTPEVHPGMSVTVTVPKEEAIDVVLLKAGAVSYYPDGSAYVLLPGEDGVITEKDVTVGLSNGNFIEIRSGLSEGDQVLAVSSDDSSLSEAWSALMGGGSGTQRQNQRNTFNRNNGGGTNRSR